MLQHRLLVLREGVAQYYQPAQPQQNIIGSVKRYTAALSVQRDRIRDRIAMDMGTSRVEIFISKNVILALFFLG